METGTRGGVMRVILPCGNLVLRTVSFMPAVTLCRLISLGQVWGVGVWGGGVIEYNYLGELFPIPQN